MARYVNPVPTFNLTQHLSPTKFRLAKATGRFSWKFRFSFQEHSGIMPIVLPPLPYNLAALEPYISRRTLEFHYGKHHAKYVENANKLSKISFLLLVSFLLMPSHTQ
jgi:hypothetical protein